MVIKGFFVTVQTFFHMGEVLIHVVDRMVEVFFDTVEVSFRKVEVFFDIVEVSFYRVEVSCLQ